VEAPQLADERPRRLAGLDESSPVVDNTFLVRYFVPCAGGHKFVSDFDFRNARVRGREVAMKENADIRIDVEAAKALIHWKSLFADEVATEARRLAAESSQPGHVTLSHYRQAAQIAVRSLSAAIIDGGLIQ
jgi:hypothetical protein